MGEGVPISAMTAITPSMLFSTFLPSTFDDEERCKADEIDDVPVDGHLPTEVVAAQAGGVKLAGVRRCYVSRR